MNVTRCFWTAAVVAMVLTLTPAAALHAQSADESAVRLQIERLVDRFNAKDPQGVANLYEPDADRRDGSGTWARGRSEVLQMYERAIHNVPNGVTIRFDFTIRVVAPGVALVDGNWVSSLGTKGPFTIVALKKSGTWLVAAGRQGAAFP